MAIQKSDAILLRRQDLRETSLILTFFTRGHGKIKGIMRGVRGSRASYGGGGLEPCSYDEIVFYERKRADIYTISQCDLLDFFNPLRESLERLAHSLYMTELLDSVTVLGDANEDVFRLLLNSIRLLAGQASPRRVTRIFEIKLLHILGLMPTLSSCVLCQKAPGARSRFSFQNGGVVCADCSALDRTAEPILAGTARFIEHIRQSPFEKVERVKVSEEVGRELERILRKFLDYHIGRRMKTLKFIDDIKK